MAEQPRDRFDDIPSGVDRVGAHRSPRKPGRGWIGFAWADQPRCKGAVVVTGDDAALVEAEARELGRAFWDAHDEFEFVAPVASMEECLAHGASAPSPYFISDSGDNPGAGGADDVGHGRRCDDL